MKKYFLSALLLAGAGLGLVSCSNGDYDANSETSYSNGINPLNPKGGMNTSFNWSGTDPMTAEINGVAWKADNAIIIEDPTDNTHWIVAGYNNAGDTSACTLRLQKNVQAGKSYFVFFGNTENTASYATSFSDPKQIYASTLANLGEVRILENDATHMKGLFYFLARSPISQLYINVQKGYFNVNKP